IAAVPASRSLATEPFSTPVAASYACSVHTPDASRVESVTSSLPSPSRSTSGFTNGSAPPPFGASGLAHTLSIEGGSEARYLSRIAFRWSDSGGGGTGADAARLVLRTQKSSSPGSPSTSAGWQSAATAQVEMFGVAASWAPVLPSATTNVS